MENQRVRVGTTNYLLSVFHLYYYRSVSSDAAKIFQPRKRHGTTRKKAHEKLPSLHFFVKFRVASVAKWLLVIRGCGSAALGLSVAKFAQQNLRGSRKFWK